MHKRATTAILVAAAGATVAGGVAIANASDSGTGFASTASDTATLADRSPGSSKPHASERSTHEAKSKSKKTTAKRHHSKKLPSGVSTATSFWDPETASGKPMSYKTLASPYWPLGTKVEITYHGTSAIGEVQDFGPAEWAVAQHNPPAIIDLSEKMMDRLTGERGNSVPVKFQVLSFGTGKRYVHSGTGYDLAWGTQDK